MDHKDLTSIIYEHEARCASASHVQGAFKIEELQELDDGIIGALDSYGEFIVYFDESQHAMRPETKYDNVAEELRQAPPESGLGFPAGVGFIAYTNAESWDETKQVVKEALIAIDS